MVSHGYYKFRYCFDGFFAGLGDYIGITGLTVLISWTLGCSGAKKTKKGGNRAWILVI